MTTSDIKNIPQSEADFVFAQIMHNKLDKFIERSFYTVVPGSEYNKCWHIDAISEALMACERGEIKRLIINIPPRSLKSISCTVAWPAWLLARNPSRGIIAASYASKLAIRHSVDTRLILESKWYQKCFPNTRIQVGENLKHRFTTTKRGFRISTSVGASAIGEGGDFLIIDDPLNPEEALSVVQRTKANRWVDQSFMSRLNDQRTGVVVLVMQRLHTDDLTGHLLEKGWEHLCIPMEFESNETIHIGNFYKEVKAGEILDPQRFPRKIIENIKKDIEPYGYAGQYLQRPAPMGGGLFKDEWWKFYKVLPKISYAIITADTAMKIKEANDFSVMQCWGKGEDGNAYLIDQLRGKWEAPDLERQFVAFWNKHKTRDYVLRAAYIEDKSSGTGLIQKIKRDHTIPVQGIKRGTADKVERANNVVGYISSGYTYLPEDASWLSDYLSEVSVFPNGRHDDQVDPTVDALQEIYNNKRNYGAMVI